MDYVGCSRLLSAVNDLTRLRLCEETAQHVTPFFRNRSTATKMCWMKKTKDAIAGIARKESARVALLQTLGEDGVI